MGNTTAVARGRVTRSGVMTGSSSIGNAYCAPSNLGRLWGPLLVNLAVTAVVVAVLMLATFAYAMRTRVHAVMDTVWALGFVIIALVSFGLSAGFGPGAGHVVRVAAGRLAAAAVPRFCCWPCGAGA